MHQNSKMRKDAFFCTKYKLRSLNENKINPAQNLTKHHSIIEHTEQNTSYHQKCTDNKAYFIAVAF